ncbi:MULTISPECIES: acylphosphatase [Rhodomicrobium]|uniref:acylphosphatase n=1 Tax=Rhodomicrobium TaxID=1068 RepID=UPI000B4AE727|nr:MULTISPECIES: acylphosphatase [Rhodomicrobium]
MRQARRTVHLRIEGRVQGVYYRAWTAGQAGELRLDGWVRNRRDGSVEALFHGETEAVADMLARCRKGPPGARVERVEIIQEGGAAPEGFRILPDGG